MSKGTAMNTAGNTHMQGKPEQEIYLRPAVDIYEDTSAITIKADLPGVPREGLDIQIVGSTLNIEGEVDIDMPEGMEALYADLNAARYRRSFTLGNELETDKISAEVKNGELTLRLPKRAELQPRKIAVSSE